MDDFQQILISKGKIIKTFQNYFKYSYFKENEKFSTTYTL